MGPMLNPASERVVIPHKDQPLGLYFTVKELGQLGEPDVKSVEVHSQLSCNGHPVDGVLVGASLLWVFTRIFFGGDISTIW